ncbi:hypothetical protein KC19_9G050200 [Ceratodon purpureus]|uniref:Uncharacterized protein n=1 Tax=Ceratodon purpureus TaxID=3225 RepID=A0A8T0GRP9_CERPU|nr:hypothetical protein KC19_9G050200 [Ceratodon purpureus]
MLAVPCRSSDCLDQFGWVRFLGGPELVGTRTRTRRNWNSSPTRSRTMWNVFCEEIML